MTMMLSGKTLGAAAGFLALGLGGSLMALSMGGAVADVPPAIHAPYGPQKVVYHVVQGGGWFGRDHAARLQSMRNHVNAVGADRLSMVVVLQGEGASMLTLAQGDAKIASMVDELRGSGVRFVICRNTLVGRKQPLHDLYGATQADLVPAGVAEVVALQQAGYSLLRL
jgi:intracellular sulfur oxidation DsrE/DsrF family protein